MKGIMLITGAASGLGFSKAEFFVKQGFQVLAGVRKQEHFDAIRNIGAEPILLDITNDTAVASACERVEQLGGVDVLINNAGVAYSGPLEMMDDQVILDTLNVNLVATIRFTQALLPFIRKKRGRIINIGSISGRFAPPGLSVYAASKFGLEGFTDALRVELQPLGVQVKIIEPGKIDTPIWEKALNYSEQHVGVTSDVSVYERINQYYIDYAQNEPSVSLEAYLKVVHRAVETHTGARYLVGLPSKLRILVGNLPTRIRDFLVRSAMKLS